MPDHISRNYLVPDRQFTDTSLIEIAKMVFLENIATRTGAQNSDAPLGLFPISQNKTAFHPAWPI
jgi:hypothetical protein